MRATSYSPHKNEANLQTFNGTHALWLVDILKKFDLGTGSGHHLPSFAICPLPLNHFDVSMSLRLDLRKKSSKFAIVNDKGENGVKSLIWHRFYGDPSTQDVSSTLSNHIARLFSPDSDVSLITCFDLTAIAVWMSSQQQELDLSIFRSLNCYDHAVEKLLLVLSGKYGNPDLLPLAVVCLSFLVEDYKKKENILTEANITQLTRLCLSRSVYPSSMTATQPPPSSSTPKLNPYLEAIICRIGLMRLLDIGVVASAAPIQSELNSFLKKWWMRLKSAGESSESGFDLPGAMPSDSISVLRLALEVIVDLVQRNPEYSAVLIGFYHETMEGFFESVSFLKVYLVSSDPKTAYISSQLFNLLCKSQVNNMSPFASSAAHDCGGSAGTSFLSQSVSFLGHVHSLLSDPKKTAFDRSFLAIIYEPVVCNFMQVIYRFIGKSLMDGIGAAGFGSPSKGSGEQQLNRILNAVRSSLILLCESYRLTKPFQGDVLPRDQTLLRIKMEESIVLSASILRKLHEPKSSSSSTTISFASFNSLPKDLMSDADWKRLSSRLLSNAQNNLLDVLDRNNAGSELDLAKSILFLAVDASSQSFAESKNEMAVSSPSMPIRTVQRRNNVLSSNPVGSPSLLKSIASNINSMVIDDRDNLNNAGDQDQDVYYDPDEVTHMDVNDADVTSLSFASAVHRTAAPRLPYRSSSMSSNVELELKVSTLLSEKKFLEGEVNVWKRKHDSTVQNNDEMKVDVQDLQLSLAGSDAQINLLRSEIDELRRNNLLASDRTDQLEARVQELQELNSSQEKVLQETYSNLALMAKSELKLKLESAAALSKCNKLQADIEGMYKEGRTGTEEVIRVSSMVEFQKAQLVTANQNSTNLSHQISGLEQQVRSIHAEKEALGDHTKILVDKLNEQRCAIDAGNQTIVAKDVALQEMANQIAALQESINQLSIQQEEKNKEIEAVRRSEEDLRGKIGSILLENESLKKDVDKHKDIITYINQLSSGQIKNVI